MLKTIKPFNFLGYYNITTFLEKYNQLDWFEYTQRQKIRFGMEDTLTVPLHWQHDFLHVRKWNQSKLFEKELLELDELMHTHFGEGTLITCVLTNLPAGKSIKMHYDAMPFFHNSHRVHIPLITNEKVIFKIHDEEKHMKVGEVWEINNAKYYHGVFNGGDTDRIHLMLDWQFK